MKVFLDALSRKPTTSVGTIAYIIAAMQIIEKKYPGSEYYMLSINPEVENNYVLKLPYKIKLIQRSASELGTIFQIRKLLKEVDVVVSSWGDAYISSPPYILFRKAIFMKKKNVPLILFTSSLGPFNGGIKDFIAYLGLRKFDVLTVRDTSTYNYLKKFSFKQLDLIHDSAFVLEPTANLDVDKILNEAKAPVGKYIGINISVLLYNKMKALGKDYPTLMSEYIAWLKKEFNLPIILIPHQIFPDNYTYTREQYISMGGDDRYAIELVMNCLQDKEGIYPLTGYYSPSELKGVIRRSEIFIGGRMHSIIGAISQCTPSLILQYSHKAGGMMKFLELEEFVWDIKDDPQAFRDKTSKLWANRVEIKQKLTDTMPAILDEVYGLADIIEKCLKK